jgi:hypothetical protein
MRFDRKSLLFMGGVCSVLAMWMFAICLVATVLGDRRPRDLVFYGLGTMWSGVLFKTIFDKL